MDGREGPGKNAMTTSQMRNIFGEVKSIEAQLTPNNWDKVLPDILLLRPKIAYNTARVISNPRNRDSRIKAFREIMELALKEVDGAERFRRFAQFFEGIAQPVPGMVVFGVNF